MAYYGVERSDEYMEHAFGERKWKKPVKYKDRKWVNGKWRYIYDNLKTKANYAVKRVKKGAEDLYKDAKNKHNYNKIVGNMKRNEFKNDVKEAVSNAQRNFNHLKNTIIKPKSLGDRGYSNSSSGGGQGATHFGKHGNSLRNLSERGYDMSKHATASGYADHKNNYYSDGSRIKSDKDRYFYYNASNVKSGTNAGRNRTGYYTYKSTNPNSKRKRRIIKGTARL
jgi:hypothetical protein